MESLNDSLFTGLFFTALGLLVLVSGGVLYLTAVEWRDRRRRNREERQQRKKK